MYCLEGIKNDIAVIYTVRNESEIKCKSASKTNGVSLCDQISINDNNVKGFVEF